MSRIENRNGVLYINDVVQSTPANIVVGEKTYNFSFSGNNLQIKKEI